MKKIILTKIWAMQESSLTAVWLKKDPPVFSFIVDMVNTSWSRTNEPSCIVIQQAYKRPNAKAKQVPYTIKSQWWSLHSLDRKALKCW